MEIVNRRVAEFRVLAVHPAARHLDLIPQPAVLLNALPARAGHQDEHDLGGCETAFAEQLAVGAEAMEYALGVVETIDAKQNDAGIAEGLPDFPRPCPDSFPAGDLFEGRRVDRDGERPDPYFTPRVRGIRCPPPGGGGRIAGLGGRHPDQGPSRRQPRRPPACTQEVRGITMSLETQQVRAEQSLDYLPAPGKLGKDLVAGKRDVGE